MWKYGKLKEFPTFPHNKQTTIVYSLYLEKCKPITGLKLKCKLITGLIIKSVNFFQDDTHKCQSWGLFTLCELFLHRLSLLRAGHNSFIGRSIIRGLLFVNIY
ncbi:hypothetical protein ACVW2L_004519 [Mucilaginibacter sp. HD30]